MFVCDLRGAITLQRGVKKCGVSSGFCIIIHFARADFKSVLTEKMPEKRFRHGGGP